MRNTWIGLWVVCVLIGLLADAGARIDRWAAVRAFGFVPDGLVALGLQRSVPYEGRIRRWRLAGLGPDGRLFILSECLLPEEGSVERMSAYSRDGVWLGTVSRAAASLQSWWSLCSADLHDNDWIALFSLSYRSRPDEYLVARVSRAGWRPICRVRVPETFDPPVVQFDGGGLYVFASLSTPVYLGPVDRTERRGQLELPPVSSWRLIQRPEFVEYAPIR